MGFSVSRLIRRLVGVTIVSLKSRDNEIMQLINAYFGETLLASIEQALINHKGDRFDIGVGYAQALSSERFMRFGEALDSWLDGGEQRRFRIFIGDHRHPNDTLIERKRKIEACTALVASLIRFARNVEERMEVVFVQRLHAKFYSMWSIEQAKDRLIWAIIGSSNLTDAALDEKNSELDIYFEPGDAVLEAIQTQLAVVIKKLCCDGESWGSLHDEIDALTFETRWQNGKLRQVEEWDAEREADVKAEER
ncbi:hypothetical protein, partial [Comamonas thiooxydans]|uniref:hypothetical protein n=1 Tax=Comamonas thiooxydans TaxID=363952 RepID=UPI0015557F03